MNIDAQIRELISNLEHESRMFACNDDYQSYQVINAITTALRNTFEVERPPFETIDKDRPPF